MVSGATLVIVQFWSRSARDPGWHELICNRYKMSYFESSVRVPLLVHHPAQFTPHRVSQNVSTIDILPTLVDLASTKLSTYLPLDGTSLLPHLQGRSGHDTVFAEYAGEGTIAPLMMIRRGPWKYIICPADPDQLYNLATDPLELTNLASPKSIRSSSSSSSSSSSTVAVLEAFRAEAAAKWDLRQITDEVLLSQRRRRLVWSALTKGVFTSWDYSPPDDGRKKYIRSHVPLDDLELRARFPPVDDHGRETRSLRVGQAGAHGE